MTWARIDDGLHDDPRAEAAGLEAMGLWTLALSYMGDKRTDVITRERLGKLAGRKAHWLAVRLVAAGWWEELPDRSFRLLDAERHIPLLRGERRREPPSEPPPVHPEVRAASKSEPPPVQSGVQPPPFPSPPIAPRAHAPTPISGSLICDPDHRSLDRLIAHEQHELFPEPETPPVPPPAPKPRTTRKAATPPPEDPSVLPPRERSVYDAIAGDVSLQPITRGVVQLAVDLCAIAPLVPDVAHVVRRAGAWMREKPQNAKRNGNSFLLNWLEREQKALAALPQPATAGSAPRIGGPPRRAPIDLPGIVGPERPIPPLRPPPVPKDVQRRVEAAIAAGEPEPTMADVHAALARIGRRRLPPDPPEASS